MRKLSDGSLEYTLEKQRTILEEILFSLGYERADDAERFKRCPSWYKVVEDDDNDSIWCVATINDDLTGRLEFPSNDDPVFIKSYYWELKDEESDFDTFIATATKAKDILIADLERANKLFEAKLQEISDNWTGLVLLAPEVIEESDFEYIMENEFETEMIAHSVITKEMDDDGNIIFRVFIDATDEPGSGMGVVVADKTFPTLERAQQYLLDEEFIPYNYPGNFDA
jgi:hypothetical protein